MRRNCLSWNFIQKNFDISFPFLVSRLNDKTCVVIEEQLVEIESSVLVRNGINQHRSGGHNHYMGTRHRVTISFGNLARNMEILFRFKFNLLIKHLTYILRLECLD